MEGEIAPASSHSVRHALKKWQSTWELNPVSSLSPLDKHGPVAFNSKAVFHLACIRLAIDIGPGRSPLEQDLGHIARRLKDSSGLQRGSMLTLAARHAIHRSTVSTHENGVYFDGRAPSCSIMHAVCSLEYAHIVNNGINSKSPRTVPQRYQCNPIIVFYSLTGK
ncbi:uncharacterized protein BDW43DRAFT_316690 [Aspergillus alliaceus]|uniref:uncharacterized protein n=1 Tax=Petromyces alliaceus TaxID=209559 RepID=UPI0012A516E6|nr:uncharacterized protein BDW43DRAFT_316690 [Aspergillus alliaceus]KAB8227573.1 hypothetical protein BDW43DRAFT_316690 [Aspergillus alliaceus]